jgi:hypothetical protein
MPASSLIRRSLNLSFKLFLEGRLPESSGSCASSNLLSIISGLLLSVRIEDEVFLRSSWLAGIGGEVGVSLGTDVFRESQENGLVRLLLAAGAVGVGFGDGCGCCVCRAVGGGPHGTEGRTPDKPCREGLEDLVGRTGFVSTETAIDN